MPYPRHIQPRPGAFTCPAGLAPYDGRAARSAGGPRRKAGGPFPRRLAEPATLAPEEYQALLRWAAGMTAELGTASVSLVEALRAILRATVDNPAATAAAKEQIRA